MHELIYNNDYFYFAIAPNESGTVPKPLQNTRYSPSIQQVEGDGSSSSSNNNTSLSSISISVLQLIQQFL